MKRHTILLLIASLASVSLAGATSDRGMSQEAVYRLANQIRKQILMLPNYGVFDSLSFSLSEGTAGVKVRLTGYASRPTLKSSAESVVKKLEGVESVDTQIEVLPTSRLDEDIRQPRGDRVRCAVRAIDIVPRVRLRSNSPAPQTTSQLRRRGHRAMRLRQGKLR